MCDWRQRSSDLRCRFLKRIVSSWYSPWTHSKPTDSLFATSYNRNCLQITSGSCGTLTLYTSNLNFASIAAMHWSQPHRKCIRKCSAWRRIYGFLAGCLCFLMFFGWYGVYVNLRPNLSKLGIRNCSWQYFISCVSESFQDGRKTSHGDIP